MMETKVFSLKQECKLFEYGNCKALTTRINRLEKKKKNSGQFKLDEKKKR